MLVAAFELALYAQSAGVGSWREPTVRHAADDLWHGMCCYYLGSRVNTTCAFK